MRPPSPGALSACAPSAPQETGAADETLATTGEAWYGSPADPATFDVVDTVDCEVLVCGLGAGGITAAAAAAEKGMNVIAIEKGAGHGASRVTSASLARASTRLRSIRSRC